jgi:Flp pilus assembly protein TadG
MAASRPRSGLRRPRRDSSPGQVLVLFALGITVLFAAAGMAFDVGRFYSERRFLQNAADAAALAAANALIRGETSPQADPRAREVLAENFTHSPSAAPPSRRRARSTKRATPATGLPANGILINGSEVRVAVQNPVGYTFGRLIGLDRSTIGGRADRGHGQRPADRAPLRQPARPQRGRRSPCPNDQTQFMDFFATADTSCLGSETNTAVRTEPSAGSAFNSANPNDNPSSHGPVVAILGQGAQPSNGADFRGFIALDIRNFAATGTQLYYNNVTPSTNSNTLKAMEANWVTIGGYPGPQFPAAITPPDPNDQVATMSGNSTGIVIDEVPSASCPATRSSSRSTRATSCRSRTSRSRRRPRSPCRRPGRPPAPAR